MKKLSIKIIQSLIMFKHQENKIFMILKTILTWKFRFKLQTSTFNFFELQLNKSNFNFKLQINSTENFNLRLQLQTAGSNFNFKFQLKNFIFKLQLQSLTRRWLENQSFQQRFNRYSDQIIDFEIISTFNFKPHL